MLVSVTYLFYILHSRQGFTDRTRGRLRRGRRTGTEGGAEWERGRLKRVRRTERGGGEKWEWGRLRRMRRTGTEGEKSESEKGREGWEEQEQRGEEWEWERQRRLRRIGIEGEMSESEGGWEGWEEQEQRGRRVRVRKAEKVEKNSNRWGEEWEWSRVQLFPFFEAQTKIIEEAHRPLYLFFKGWLVSVV